MPFTTYKTKKLQLIFIVYWFLLVYIIAALVWWFIALSRQNSQMAQYEIQQLVKDAPGYYEAVQKIEGQQRRKEAQYIGEGVVFFLVIMSLAFIIFRAVKKQLKLGLQQQHLMMAITHELKTPIAITKLNLETLQKRKLEEQQQQRLVQNTIQEANRLNDLCSNILLSAQIEGDGYHISKESLNLSALVEEAVQGFVARFSGRHISSQVQPGIFIYGDRLMLQMAVNNLIDNALKYSPKEGTVLVSLMASGKLIQLTVADEGKGIDDAEKQKVFEKYYRTGNAATKAAKGTGLGLYLTKKIARQHKAKVAVKDNSPAGSIFAITFKQ
ncbi:MAG TPA: ATP-binding protein [Ferruginibacter sp.]|nr:ATP-binding protein [Ferruginibacter sp.]HMP20704.1 ATP-binding protein [Ferruginibacter sp.]